MNGNAVMYDVGKILTVGGAPAYQNGNAHPGRARASLSDAPHAALITDGARQSSDRPSQVSWPRQSPQPANGRRHGRASRPQCPVA
jgi:hypothetical protein